MSRIAPTLRLHQMHAAATEACRFVEDMTIEDFRDDARTRMAVAMALVLVGEGATRIVTDHADLAVDHPEIAWSNIMGMGDLVLDAYYRLEPAALWAAVSDTLPGLILQLEQLRNWHAQGE